MFDSSQDHPGPQIGAAAADTQPDRRTALAAADRRIGEAQGHINAAVARQLLDLARFDELGGWSDQGAKSCEEWLSWRCGIAPVEARWHVRVARRLNELPEICAAFEKGALSYWQVRALAPIATPEIERELLEIARNSTAGQLQQLARAYKGALDRAELDRSNARHTGRSLTHHYDEDGFLVVRAALSPEEGAVLLTALEAAEKALEAEGAWTEESDECGDPVGAAARRADALVEVARKATTAAEGNEAQPSAIVHLDVPSLINGSGEICQLEDGPALASETARRLTCDAVVQALYEDGERVLNVGRRRRTVPPRLRLALERRDATCRFPGCNRKRFRDGHHILHWTRNGETKSTNVVLLCKHHHRLVHEGRFRVEGDADGELIFRRPDGALVEPQPEPTRGYAAALVTEARQRKLAIDERTCTTEWDGYPMDFETCVHALLGKGGMLAAPTRGP